MSKKREVEIQDENEQNQTEAPADTQIPDAETDTEPESNGEMAAAATEDDLTAKLKEAQQQAQDHYDRLLRVSAEFDNYKKRSRREMQDVVKYANEKLFKELLTVVDNLERARDSAVQDHGADDSLVQGLDLTLDEVNKLLERNHITPIEAMGQPFDPNFHQAMMQEEVQDKPSNTVVREMQKGYLIHDRLLRPAMVAVSKGGDQKAQSKD